MSAARNLYFHDRRERLCRKHLCTRCGCEKPKKGRKLCSGCLVVMAVKKMPDATAAEIKAKEAKRLRLIHRLDLINEARAAVLEELDRTG